jgi:hypothetical protein
VKVYERENGRKTETQPTHSWWIDAKTREDFDEAVARESLRMRAMRVTTPRPRGLDD